MGGGVEAAGAAGAGTATGPVAVGTTRGGNFMKLMKELGPVLFQQGSKENEAALTALAQAGPPPQVQPIGAGGPAGVGQSLGTRYADAMRPRNTLPTTPRGAAMTQPTFPGVGGALSGGH